MAKNALTNVIQKPWGHELIIASNDVYVVKQLYVKTGHRLSLQAHREKEEHITLVSGKASIYLEGPDFKAKQDLEKMIPVYIGPGIIHRIMANEEEDAILVEVSTPQLDDVVRLHDDYGRDVLQSDTLPVDENDFGADNSLDE